MPHRLAIVLTAFLTATHASAQATEPTQVPAIPAQEQVLTQPELVLSDTNVALSDFLWSKRPIVVFADSELDPRFSQQMERINALPHELLDRDVVVLTDTDPDAKSALRQELRPRGFMMVLMGKDGVVYLRKPQPWTVREISAAIDKWPLRQQEMREQQRAPAGR